MKIAIHPVVERPEPLAFRRNVRRLLYLGRIAASAGHSVWLAPLSADDSAKLRRPEMTEWLLALAAEFPEADSFPPGTDLAICSNSHAARVAAYAPDIPLIVFKEDIDYRKDRGLLGIADLIPCCVWRREDFSECRHRPPDEPDHEEVMRPVVLPVPWLPHDRVLLQLEADGLAEAYLTDDLDAIRNRYSGKKRWRLGFLGADVPQTRREALAALQRTGLLDFCRTYAPEGWSQPAGEYLRWLSQCMAIPEVPGDQWNCYRFAEAVLMGVPVVRLAGKAEFAPPVTPENCILIDDWADREAIEAGLQRSGPIAAEADRCYRAGWSLKGQFERALRRLGLQPAAAPEQPSPESAAAPSGREASGRHPAECARTAKPRVLLIADFPGWIFARHCRMLERFLGDEFRFVTKYANDPFREADFDLIYPLEWNLAPRDRIRTPGKYITGIRSHISWQGEEFLTFVDFLATHFQRVHLVSRRLERLFAPFLPGCLLLSHGVDTEFFTPSSAADSSGCGRLRIGWAGNRVNATKGFERYIEPLAGLPGVELRFCGYQDQNLGLDEMRAFYKSIDVYVCASSVHHEGNNNCLMEAAAMRRAIVTTDNGAVPEYLHHGESALIVERELPAFIEAVVRLRDDPALRVRLGSAARAAVQSRFEWRDRAGDYRSLFREALAGREYFFPRFAAGRRAVARASAGQGAVGITPRPEPFPRSPLRVGLFGASSRGRQLLKQLAEEPGLLAACFFDNDPAKRGTAFESLPVLAPEITNLVSVDAILLASVAAREIYEQLAALGLERLVAFDVPDLIHQAGRRSVRESGGDPAP